MKRSYLTALVAMVLGLAMAGVASAEAKDAKESKTVAGKSSCATCDGVTAKDHAIMIVAEDGTRWVLLGDKDTKGYKEAHKVRKEGKTITATLAGEPETKKDSNGKEYKEVKVSEVKLG